jgi:hypothetical protein
MTVVSVENPSSTDFTSQSIGVSIMGRKPTKVITVGKPLAIPHPSRCM